MDEEDEKKKKKRDWGSTIASIIQTVKLLMNPIIFWGVIIILAIIILIGYISYFTSIPGQILGKIGTWLSSLGKIGQDGIITANKEEIINLCTYLEEMGYDVEGYGFVQSINREGDLTYNSENAKGTPSRGKIVSVTSKYLEAYIISEKKMFAISNPKANVGALTIAVNEDQYSQDLLEIAVDTVLARYEDSEFSGTLLAKTNEYKEYLKSKGEDVSRFGDGIDYIKQAVAMYYTYELYSPTSIGATIHKWLVNIFGNGQVQVDGAQFIGWLKDKNRGNDASFAELMENVVHQTMLLLDFSDYKFSGDGLIYLDDNEGTYFPFIGTWKYEGTDYEVEIDEPKRLFIIKMPMEATPLVKALGLEKLSKYGYDLNNWTTKYGKPQEFLIAVHTSTMAPEFAYKLASSAAVDTKVHVSLFPTTINITVVPEDKSDESVLSMLEGANSDGTVLDALKKLITEIIDGLVYNDVSNAPDKNTANRALTNYYNQNWFGLVQNPYPGVVQSKEEYDQNPTDANFKSNVLKATKYLLKNRILKNSITEIYAGINSCGVDKIKSETADLTLSSLGITNDSYSIIADLPLAYFDDAITVIKELEAPINVATPYITKVIKHWYRNQYFTNVGGDVEYDKKQRVKTLVYNVYNKIYGGKLDNSGLEGFEDMSSLEDLLKQEYATIDALGSDDAIDSYVDSFEAKWENTLKPALPHDNNYDEIVEYVKNEFIAVRAQLANSDFNGGAYKIEGNPEPFWFAMEELYDKGDFDIPDTVVDFIKSLTIKEKRVADIMQIHNPLFEDNSQYIRNWLKEKYEIFEGKNNVSEDAQKNDKGEKIVSSGNEKRYIQGKTALQALRTQLEQTNDIKSDMVYLIRNIKELFEDFEFDLENRDIPETKVLSNILPSYKPYTPWPSVYEKSESNCTKIIYKGSSDIVAPEKCIVRAAENGVIDLEFNNSEPDGMFSLGMTMRIASEQGSMSIDVSKGNIVAKGEKIGSVSGSGAEPVILKLNLFTATKQIIRVEDYMKIDHKTYNDLTSLEKMVLYHLIDRETQHDDDVTMFSQGNAIVNIILNRISSPYCAESDIFSLLSQPTYCDLMGFKEYAKHIPKDTDVKKFEKNTAYKSAINGALMGIDVTRTDTLLGATNYFASYSSNDTEAQEEILEEQDKYKVSIIIKNRLFGITNSEYEKYVEMLVDKKIYEVLYELDIYKYLEGIEEQEGGYDTTQEIIKHQEEIFKLFENAKEEIATYFESENFITDCGGIRFKNPDTVVAILEKTNVFQKKEEQENGNTKITDCFTLTANSNYGIKWELSYEVGVEGKVISEKVDVKHTAISNY